MQNILTFVIPLRHPENSRDWQSQKRYLEQTLGSIAGQDASGWKAVVVANHGSDLPSLPAGVEVAFVDFPPNPMAEQGSASLEEFRDALRFDKGRRLLAGMLHAGKMGYVMTVDDDDFVSARLTSFVAANFGANGWFFRNGYVWSGGRLLYRHPNFSRLCGTSHIIRADILRLPASLEEADPAYVRRMLGSHIFVHDHLDAMGKPLAPLPFTGALYRTGHAGAHTRSRTILDEYFWHIGLLRHPRELLRRIFRLRLNAGAIRQEFFARAG